MDQSQRCTKDVWSLANELVISAKDKPEAKNAFYQIFMKPVDGKNPNSSNAIKPLVLENEFVEKNYILKQIKELLSKDPKATMGFCFEAIIKSQAGLNLSTTQDENHYQKRMFGAKRNFQKPFLRY